MQTARAGAARIGLATMRIIKPGEDGFLNQFAACEPDAVLVRNLSALAYFSDKRPEIVADYSLNVVNELTAGALLRGSGWRRGDSRLLRLTPGHDMNAAQLEAMLGRIGGQVFEMVLHQQMPMFHMEHCVFAHMLSNGKDYHDCGRPCEKHRVSLRDRVGVEHPLAADAGCRNTVYNGRAQSIAAYVLKLRSLGVEHFRVEALREDAAQMRELLEYYWQVLNGTVSANRPGTRLKVLDLMGVTPGTMEFE
jgi:putative protease